MQPTEPELWGIPTANVALGLSVLTFLGLLVTVAFTVKTYRRGGAHVRLEFGTGRPLNPDDGTEGGNVFLITATNEGFAPAQVTGLAIEVENSPPLHLFKFSGSSKLPTTLAGLHNELWSVPFEWLPFTREPGPVLKVRAVATVAGMKNVRSEWIQVQFE